MFTGMELTACQNLAVPAELMRHVVHVESDANPYAIGVVGERLLRQPRNLGEALATVRMLDAGHYNYSLGLAQVNRANLHAYGLDSYRKAFMPCPNVAAGAQILADCYARSRSDWGKAFSCYYAGNFVTGYRDGYVQKIHDSIDHDSVSDSAKPHATAAVPGAAARQVSSGTGHPNRNAARPGVLGAFAYRVAIRSTALDMAASTLPATGASAIRPAQPGVSTQPPSTVDSTTVPASTHGTGATTADPVKPTTMEVFVPQVHGPGDPSSPDSSTFSAPGFSTPTSNAKDLDRADLRKEHGDAAFVF